MRNFFNHGRILGISRRESTCKFFVVRWIVLVPRLLVIAAFSVTAQSAAAQGNLRTLYRDIQRLPASDIAPRDKARLKTVANQLLAAETALAHQSATMTPREQAMAEAQLLAASESLQTAVAEQGRSALALFGAEQSAQDASASAQRKGGPVRRPVEVQVTATRPGSVAPPMDVYALPLIYITRGVPASMSDAKLRHLLDVGRFTQPTSPSTDRLETHGDYALWIAPPNRIDALLPLVRQRALTNYRRVSAGPSEPITLVLSEDDQVRLPSPPRAAEPASAATSGSPR